MAKDLVLEEYEEEYEDYDDYDDYDAESYDYDYSEDSYDSYDNYSSEEEDYDDNYEEIEERKFNPGSVLSVIALISTWFIRIGATMGICLLIAFFVMGKIATAFLYVIGIVGAFFFGYGFMFCLDYFMVKKSN